MNCEVTKDRKGKCCKLKLDRRNRCQSYVHAHWDSHYAIAYPAVQRRQRTHLWFEKFAEPSKIFGECLEMTYSQMSVPQIYSNYYSARISGLFYTEKVVLEHKANSNIFQAKQ